MQFNHNCRLGYYQVCLFVHEWGFGVCRGRIRQTEYYFVGKTQLTRKGRRLTKESETVTSLRWKRYTETGIYTSYPDKSVACVHLCLDKSVIVCAMAKCTTLVIP